MIFTLNELTLIPLISLILYVFILVIILTSNQTKLSRAFRYYIISMIIWSLGSFLMKSEIGDALFWNKYVTQVGFVFVPVFLLQFSYALINKTGKSHMLRTSFVASSLMVILSFTGNVISSAEVINGDFVYELEWGAYVLAVVSSVISIVALYTMIKAVQKEQVNIKKVQLVIVGLALVIIGGALNINEFLGRYAIDIIFNAINAILITYSIYRSKFLEINIIVKRGLYFSIYNITLFAIYASVIIVLYNFLTHQLNSNLTTTILVMSPVFMILEPVRRLLQKWTDHLFYRANKDRQIVLNDFSSIISTSFSLEKITASLLESIQNGIESRQVSILLKNSNKFKLHDTTIDNIAYDQSSFKFNHPILTWFENGNDILLKSEIDNDVVFKGLWDSEKLVIVNYQTELVVPIIYLKDVVGVVVISDREDESPYSDVEIQFLKTLLNNAAAIIENAKTLEILKRQSITDELTKLYNHRYFHETVGRWVKSGRYEQFSVAMVDIDQFKIYNDLYGHRAGDIALQRIALIIDENTPEDALLVRYGGEEYGIFFPEYTLAQTNQAIEKIRKAVEDKFLLSTEIREFLTVTAGASHMPTHGKTLEEIISNAFSAVKHGKQSGRNKAFLYNDEEVILDEVQINVQAKIREAYLSSTYALAATIDAKDHYTYGHSNNVAELSVALAKEADFKENDLDIIRNAGLLHDIGKVGIPESVLLKKGYLTDKEMETMRSHVVQSINIIKHIPNLIDTIPVIISHHERYDGGGYPRGIKGDNIPVLGRVICIADAFDAMTTDRPYRKGLSLDQALYELQKNAGTQFDPDLVDKFIGLANRGILQTLSLENRPSF